jgi:hypothetical protein
LYENDVYVYRMMLLMILIVLECTIQMECLM